MLTNIGTLSHKNEDFYEERNKAMTDFENTLRQKASDDYDSEGNITTRKNAMKLQ